MHMRGCLDYAFIAEFLIVLKLDFDQFDKFAY